MLELEHVRKYYESPSEQVHAVDEVSMTVDAAELVAIFGPSGSGKTTLLLLAAGLLRADAGTVRFDGRDLAALSSRELRRYRRTELGLVFQDFRLPSGLTAEENVALPLLTDGIKHEQARQRALAALNEVGLEHRARHLPDRLSGGERQRVAIARALVRGPKLILADEPTGNLDSENSEAMLDLLSSLPGQCGAAIILVTHDAQLAQYADRVLTMRDGKLTEREPALSE